MVVGLEGHEVRALEHAHLLELEEGLEGRAAVVLREAGVEVDAEVVPDARDDRLHELGGLGLLEAVGRDGLGGLDDESGEDLAVLVELH